MRPGLFFLFANIFLLTFCTTVWTPALGTCFLWNVFEAMFNKLACHDLKPLGFASQF